GKDIAMPTTSHQRLTLCSDVFYGHASLVLWRDTPHSKTEMCPFCYRRHLHTPEDGHRASHCCLWENKRITLADGTTVCAFDGYIVRSRSGASKKQQQR